MLRILTPWDSQPQVGEATAAEGLGLTALILPGQSDYDLVSGIRLSSVSATPTKTVGSFGQALQLNANQESIYTTTTDAQRTAIASIVWAGTLQGTPTVAACLGGTTFNGSNGAPYVGIEIKRSATPNNLQLAYSYGASTGTYENLTSTGTYTTGNIVAVGVFESGRQSFVIKSSTGLEIRSNTRAGSISYQSTARIEIGDSLNARNPAADCALLALSNQAWSLEQAISVANDVWGQLFRPRSIWVPVSVLGGGGPTTYYKSLGGILTTSAAARKRITAVPRASSMTPAGAITAQVKLGKTVTGSLTPAGLIRRRVSKGISGVLTGTGVLRRNTKRIVLGSLTAAGMVVRKVKRKLTGSLTGTSVLTDAMKVLKATAGSLTGSGSLSSFKYTPVPSLISRAAKGLYSMMSRR